MMLFECQLGWLCTGVLRGALPPLPLTWSRLRVSNSWERVDISPGMVVWDVSPPASRKCSVSAVCHREELLIHGELSVFCGGDRGLWELCFAAAQPPFAGQGGAVDWRRFALILRVLYWFSHLLQLQQGGYFPEGWVVSQG